MSNECELRLSDDVDLVYLACAGFAPHRAEGIEDPYLHPVVLGAPLQKERDSLDSSCSRFGIWIHSCHHPLSQVSR